MPLAASRATGVASPSWQGARSGASRGGSARGLRSASSAALIPEVKGNLARQACRWVPPAVPTLQWFMRLLILFSERYLQVYWEPATEGPECKDLFVTQKRGRRKSTQNVVVRRQQFKKKKI